MQLRPEQWDAFAHVLQIDLEQRLTTYFSSSPDFCHLQSTELLQLVRQGERYAISFHFETESAIFQFVALHLLLGADWVSSRTWIGSIIGDDSISDVLRMLRIRQGLREELEGY